MLYITAIHGNEPIPVFTLASLGVSQLVCNDQALVMNKRFIEKDMNQSFGTDGKTLEELRAKEILKLIYKSEQIIDFHSMSAISDPFVIVTDLKMVPLAATTGLRHVVYMNYNIKSGHALINHRDGVSVEVGLHNDLQSFEITKEILKNVKKGKTHKFTLYEVYGVIEKVGKYNNFKAHEDGFIPVLAGEKAYNTFGLKAKKI